MIQGPLCRLKVGKKVEEVKRLSALLGGRSGRSTLHRFSLQVKEMSAP